MTDDTPTTHWTNLQSGDTTPGGHLPPDYHAHSDDRMRECYRRNSRLLQKCGSDEQTIRTLCAVKERLRARDIDPSGVVAGLDT